MDIKNIKKQYKAYMTKRNIKEVKVIDISELDNYIKNKKNDH